MLDVLKCLKNKIVYGQNILLIITDKKVDSIV